MNKANPLHKPVLDGTPTCNCDVEERALCAGLTPEGMRGVRSIRGNSRLAAQQTVFREGDPAEHVYTLMSGTVKLSKLLLDGRRQIIGFLFPGDFFGFGLDGAYGYTAEAVTDVALCRFAESRLMRLAEDMPELGRRLTDRLVSELAFAQEQMLLLGRMTAREKVARFLLSLSRRAERRGEPATPIAVPMSRLDIADYLGLTIETVSRTLTALKREGLVALPSGHMVALRDAAALRRIAEGQANS